MPTPHTPRPFPPRPTADDLLPTTEEQQWLQPWGITRIPLDTPFRSEPVNVYLVKGNPNVLIDGGLRHLHNLDRIEQACQRAGIQLEDIGEIWISHPHVDHFGLAHKIAQRANATIRCWAGSQHRFEEYLPFWSSDRAFFVDLLERSGGPQHLLDTVRNSTTQFHEVADTVQIHQTFTTNDTLQLAGRIPVQPIHIPGHSPWCIGLWAPDPKLLWSFDTLLKRVRFSVILYPTHECPPQSVGFAAYERSLQHIQQLNPTLILPGHGHAYTDTKRQIQRACKQIRRRQEQMLQWVQDGPTTAYDIAISMFGEDITHGNLLLVISDVVGQLQWLQAERQIHTRPSSHHHELWKPL